MNATPEQSTGTAAPSHAPDPPFCVDREALLRDGTAWLRRQSKIKPNSPDMLSDYELADILIMTVGWVRAHSNELPGFERLGSYFRFRSKAIEGWLGGPERLLVAEDVAALMNVPTSWVYANADQIPGVLRLGHYVRFRPATIHQFLAGSETCQ